MRKWILFISCIAGIAFWLEACQRAYSYEGGIPSVTLKARGSMQDLNGNCMNISVYGKYIPDTALSLSNIIQVSANISSSGKFSIYTDTINGYWFKDTGIVSNSGIQSFQLKGYGIPLLPVSTTFNVYFDSSVCVFTIPPNAAVYNFDAPLGNCPLINVFGLYRVGATLYSADSVVVPIKVLIPGTYSIKTSTINGITFSANGIFLHAGLYAVSLKGSGMPATVGIAQIPLTVASTTCSFTVKSIRDTSMYWKFSAEGYNYSGLMDSAYGGLADTGLFIIGNPNRIFAFNTGGGDNNNNMDSSLLTLVISRLNTQITTGAYHSNTPLGGSDMNAYMSFHINNNLSANNYIYSSAYLNGFTINVTSFDKVSKLLQGNFSGPVYKLQSINNTTGPIVNITNGVFKTYLAY
jgi:hypothetical protein